MLFVTVVHVGRLNSVEVKEEEDGEKTSDEEECCLHIRIDEQVEMIKVDVVRPRNESKSRRRKMAIYSIMVLEGKLSREPCDALSHVRWNE